MEAEVLEAEVLEAEVLVILSLLQHLKTSDHTDHMTQDIFFHVGVFEDAAILASFERRLSPP